MKRVLLVGVKALHLIYVTAAPPFGSFLVSCIQVSSLNSLFILWDQILLHCLRGWGSYHLEYRFYLLSCWSIYPQLLQDKRLWSKKNLKRSLLESPPTIRLLQ